MTAERDLRRSQQSRDTPTALGAADSDPDAGLSGKYGVTSSATLDGTINPDFSQVESDAFQVEVNQRFPLFFSEKRPFFMEGMGIFELAGVGGDAVMRTAVHTRRIVDPVWGMKTTGTQGRVGFGLLPPATRPPAGARRRAPNRFRATARIFYIARTQYSLGRPATSAASSPTPSSREATTAWEARDISLRFGQHSTSATVPGHGHALAATAASARTAWADRPNTPTTRKRIVFVTQMEHYDRGFQMDTAFMNQVGITQGWTFVAPSFYPDAKKHPWFKRIVPFVFTQYGNDRVQNGKPGSSCPACACIFTRQGFFRVDGHFGHEAWIGRTLPQALGAGPSGRSRSRRWLHLVGSTTIGRSIFYDPVDPYLGASRSYFAEVDLQPSARFNQTAGVRPRRVRPPHRRRARLHRERR